MKLCTVEGCGRPYFAKGLCRAHYNAKRRRERCISHNSAEVTLALREQRDFLRREAAKREARLAKLIRERLSPEAIQARMGDEPIDPKRLRTKAKRMGYRLRSEEEMNWDGIA
jgi:hypothetical protein